ncbi:Retrovirus-related Pol polyprotein from transposon opus [Gossypium australe]|uniref:Retrovirus-related Pol polyprotein from transposon opus n=1 Tax=Gossypium australe TaxID=47621 RepID=A0A5B6VKV6_9ROSI|nr:Retrovirus-related Pol polyprotein from transposon opus [Gossypium australe]
MPQHNNISSLKESHCHLFLSDSRIIGCPEATSYQHTVSGSIGANAKLREFETIALIEGCTAMLINKLPPKLKDLGSFTIPCSIENNYVGKPLCDIKKLGIGKARPTTVTLQLAGCSYAHLEGKIEDVLVRVDTFIFPTNFIILESEADKDVLIILGRPFLATGRTLTDVQKVS